MDPALADYCRAGYCRAGVYRDDWDRLIRVFEGITGSGSVEMTRRELIVADSSDSVTGWFDISYSDSTIEGLLIEKDAIRLQSATGVYVTNDVSLLTVDPVKVDDQIQVGTDYYKVLSVVEKNVVDSFSHRVCSLERLPLYAEA